MVSPAETGAEEGVAVAPSSCGSGARPSRSFPMARRLPGPWPQGSLAPFHSWRDPGDPGGRRRVASSRGPRALRAPFGPRRGRLRSRRSVGSRRTRRGPGDPIGRRGAKEPGLLPRRRGRWPTEVSARRARGARSGAGGRSSTGAPHGAGFAQGCAGRALGPCRARFGLHPMRGAGSPACSRRPWKGVRPGASSRPSCVGNRLAAGRPDFAQPLLPRRAGRGPSRSPANGPVVGNSEFR